MISENNQAIIPIGKVISFMFGKQNIFTIVQIVWIIELYYLGINVINYNIIRIKLPKYIEQYNYIILEKFQSNYTFIFQLGVMFILCGLSFFL